ncbi:MAG: O-antigen ligase family protein [Aggregatilineales bacterium]
MGSNMYATWRLKAQTIRWSIVAGVMAIAGAIGFLTARDRITEKIGVTLIAAVGIFYVLLQGKRAYWALFCIGIATIALGHRGIYTDAKTYLVALQIIILALFAVLLTESVAGRQPFGVKMPIALTFMTIWAVLHALATILAILTGQEGYADNVMAWITTFAVGFPAFYVVGKLVKSETQVIQILKILMVISAVMSVLGIIEFYFPSIASLLPGVFTGSSFVAQDGFQRAEFSFWGYPAAASIISWGMFVAFDQLSNSKSLISVLIASAILIVDGIAIFISGQRSSWIAVVIGLVILNFNMKKRTLLITGVLLVSMIFLLPAEFWNRVSTLTSIVLNGQVIDTSSQSRLDRWQAGIDIILHNPLTGGGYEGGLVHDSVLEIGSRIGLIPAVVFLLFLFQLVIRILGCRALPSATARRYGLLFMALVVPWIIQMAVEADLQVQPFAIAQWTFLALAWFLPDIFRNQLDARQLTTNTLHEENQT